jgi:hypothetical protein
MKHESFRNGFIGNIALFIFLFMFFFPGFSLAGSDSESIKSTPISQLSLDKRKSMLIKPEDLHLYLPKEKIKFPVIPPSLRRRIPLSIDWRNNNGNFITSVKDQGFCNNCGPEAATAAVEAKTLITNGSPGIDINLAEMTLVACENSGSFLMQNGLPLEECFPYQCPSSATCIDACKGWEKATVKLSNVQFYYQPTVEQMKVAIYRNGPISAFMEVFNDLFGIPSNVNDYVYKHNPTSQHMGSHFVSVIGYNDNANCFIVKNSWGQNWGTKGFFNISYDEVTQGCDFGKYIWVYGDAILPVAEAVDAPSLKWKTGGDGLWWAEPNAQCTGGSAAVSPSKLANNQTSWIETYQNFKIAGHISFKWRISSGTAIKNGLDSVSLSFFIDNINKAIITGDTAWQNKVFNIKPGIHKFRWVIKQGAKSGIVKSSGRGWLDSVQF